MATFGDLQQGSYYVIQEIENSTLELVYVPLVTEKCVLIEFQDEDQTLSWNRKTDPLFEVVEELNDEQAVIYESLFADDDDDDDLVWDKNEEDDDFWDIDEEGDTGDDPSKHN